MRAVRPRCAEPAIGRAAKQASYGRVVLARKEGIVVKERGNLVPVGNFTVKPNHREPFIGAIVECKHLYLAAARESPY